MHLASLLCLAAAAGNVVARSPAYLSRMLGRPVEDPAARIQAAMKASLQFQQAVNSSRPRYLNPKTQRFSVDGRAIPDVDFDIGESYAGLLPISSDANEPRQLYFWYFPSMNPLAEKEVTIWLNGGPGCSSLEGLLQENGPFLWQYGTFKPVPNPWTWVNLTNVLWVEQPVGTGFSQGSPKATTEADVAHEFMGFFKNFIDTFDMHNAKIYITGESYAGMYVPHIASAMLDTRDSVYFNVEGTMIYDPSINSNAVMTEIPAVAFLDNWKHLFSLNDTHMDYLHRQNEKCGYKAFLDKYLVYPPKGRLPSPPSLNSIPGGCDLYTDIQTAAALVNPCWDIYQVATTCPLLYDPLGFPGSFPYLPPGAKIYFNRPDVKRAINAPVDVHWEECSINPVYNTSSGNSVDADANLYSGLTVLPGVIDRSARTIIAHGSLDMVLMSAGTLLTIQNMTFGGRQGFDAAPSGAFYVPYHNSYQDTTLAAAGVMGVTHTERKLTYCSVSLSGHMVPQYQPSAAYRQMEFLLGRVPSLESTAPFTVSSDGLVGQPDAPQ